MGARRSNAFDCEGGRLQTAGREGKCFSGEWREKRLKWAARGEGKGLNDEKGKGFERDDGRAREKR